MGVMRTAEGFMNVYPDNSRHGYILRLCGVHVDYFGGFDDGSLKRALKARNRFYVQFQYMPEGILIRDAKPCQPTPETETGFSGVGFQICYKRKYAPPVVIAKVQNLRTRKQTNVQFLISNSNRKKSAGLKEAIATRNKNVSQHNRIAANYNKMRLRRLMPLALQEARSLEPILYTFNCFDPIMWEKALKKTFPKGLENTYLARE